MDTLITLLMRPDVTLTIYNATGVMVRQLHLGHQPAGYYTDKTQAAYWNGQNQFGEQVASGVYFYRLQAVPFFRHPEAGHH